MAHHIKRTDVTGSAEYNSNLWLYTEYSSISIRIYSNVQTAVPFSLMSSERTHKLGLWCRPPYDFLHDDRWLTWWLVMSGKTRRLTVTEATYRFVKNASKRILDASVRCKKKRWKHRSRRGSIWDIYGFLRQWWEGRVKSHSVIGTIAEMTHRLICVCDARCCVPGLAKLTDSWLLGVR